MKIDNFDKILPLLEFGKDTYYFIQIIKRKKDPGNEGMEVPELCLWQRFIDTPKTLINLRQEISNLCESFNARAYIELNPRSLEKWSIELARKLLDRISLQEFQSVYRLPSKVALSEETIRTRNLSTILQRRWLLDVDEKSSIPIVEDWIKENEIKLVNIIPTISGAHFIIGSFNYKKLDLKLGGTVRVGDISFVLSPNANTFIYL